MTCTEHGWQVRKAPSVAKAATRRETNDQNFARAQSTMHQNPVANDLEEQRADKRKGPRSALRVPRNQVMSNRRERSESEARRAIRTRRLSQSVSNSARVSLRGRGSEGR
jgi:hypothetical protein